MSELPVAEIVSSVVIPLMGYAVKKLRDIEAQREVMNEKQNIAIYSIAKAVNCNEKTVNLERLKELLLDGIEEKASSILKETD